VIGLRLDVFEINANVGGSGDRDEGMIGRVREIEFEPVAEFRAEVRLAECVVNKAYLARLGLEIAAQKVAQHPARDNETLPIALESKACTPGTFIGRKGRIEASGRFRRNVQTGAPTMNFAGHQLKRVHLLPFALLASADAANKSAISTATLSGQTGIAAATTRSAESG